MTYLEILGAVLGSICIYYNAKANLQGWYWGVASIIVYIYIFWETKLYADISLQIFFLLNSIYGIYQWKKNVSVHDEILVSKSTISHLGIYSLAFIAIYFSIYYIFDSYTDAAVPAWDSFNTALSVVAQILLAKRKIENWLLWIIADISYVCMYIYQKLYITALFYTFITFVAVYGYSIWIKKYKLQQST